MFDLAAHQYPLWLSQNRVLHHYLIVLDIQWMFVLTRLIPYLAKYQPHKQHVTFDKSRTCLNWLLLRALALGFLRPQH